MRKVLISAMTLLVLATAYLAWPFLSAWQLRQAVKHGNVATIEQKVEWDAVRASLKASLARYAGLVHRTWAPADLHRTSAPAGLRRPSLWQRLKSRYGRSAVDRLVNRMITPQGLPKLFAARENYRHKWRPALGFARPKRAFEGTWLAGGRIARLADSVERVQRVVFTSLTRIEIEIIDRYRPDRHYVTVLQLKDFDWKLVGLRLVIPRG